MGAGRRQRSHNQQQAEQEDNQEEEDKDNKDKEEVVAFTQPAASGGGKNLSLFWQNLRMVFSSICSSGWGIGQKADAGLFPIHKDGKSCTRYLTNRTKARMRDVIDRDGWMFDNPKDLKNDLLSGHDGKLKF